MLKEERRGQRTPGVWDLCHCIASGAFCRINRGKTESWNYMLSAKACLRERSCWVWRIWQMWLEGMGLGSRLHPLPQHQCLETLSYSAGAWHLIIQKTFPTSNTCICASKGQNRNMKISGWKLFIAKISRKAPILMCKMLVTVRCSVPAQFDHRIYPALRARNASWRLMKMRPPRAMPSPLVVALRIPVGWCFVVARTEVESPVPRSLWMRLACRRRPHRHAQLPRFISALPWGCPRAL